MATGRLVVTLGDELDNRCYESVSEFSGDGFGGRLENVVVLARGDVRSVLLDSSRGNDYGRLSFRESVSNLHPCHFLDEDGVESINGARRVGIRGCGLRENHSGIFSPASRAIFTGYNKYFIQSHVQGVGLKDFQEFVQEGENNAINFRMQRAPAAGVDSLVPRIAAGRLVEPGIIF